MIYSACTSLQATWTNYKQSNVLSNTSLGPTVVQVDLNLRSLVHGESFPEWATGYSLSTDIPELCPLV